VWDYTKQMPPTYEFLPRPYRYGQTNCFVGTAIKYGLFAVNETDVYLCTHRAVRNMAYQGASLPRGEVNQLAEIDGTKLVGTRIKAPFGVNPEVYVLPMDNVLPTKVRLLHQNAFEFSTPFYYY
jgi:leucyl-tRNA synthetase